ncbi:MAG: hypothetical protein LBM96_05865 [Methanobrevibacter sp.]|jgi:hypothetical protein|nr:hypothetical protein [Candidatus Methanoflexus mossambicus]
MFDNDKEFYLEFPDGFFNEESIIESFNPKFSDELNIGEKVNKKTSVFYIIKNNINYRIVYNNQEELITKLSKLNIKANNNTYIENGMTIELQSTLISLEDKIIKNVLYYRYPSQTDILVSNERIYTKLKNILKK